MSLTRNVAVNAPAGTALTVATEVAGAAKFLTAALSSPDAPASVRVSASAASLAPGAYTGTVVVAGAGQDILRIPVTLNVTAPGTATPAISDDGVTNAASFSAASLAPGSIATIWGVNLASGVAANISQRSLPASLGGVSVTVNGIAAPLFFVSPGQINFQVPYETAPGSASVSVSSNGSAASAVPVKVEPARPGIFLLPDGKRAAALNLGYTVNAPGNPVAPGGVISIYATGLGQTDIAVPTGAPAPLDRLARCLQQVEATIGGKPAQVQFAGLAPGFAGLMQVNLIVPDLASQDQPVLLTVNGVPSNPALISVGK